MMGHGYDHGHEHNESTGPAFEVQIERWEGHLVHAVVDLHQTVPAGGLSLNVVYEPRNRRIVEVRPWRNLGTFVLDAIDAACGLGGGGHH